MNPDFILPKPPLKGIGRILESQTRKALLEFKMLKGAKKLGLALSGGKDSLGLLFLLNAILGRGFPPLDLVAIHIKGPFSCGANVSESFLQSVCDQLSVPLIIKTCDDLPQESDCYSCSRRRRSLIFQAAKEAGCKRIAFGHHEDDLAQTLLLNLFQKGHIEGLLPKIKMVKYGVTIIRPLIYIQERQLITFAKLHGFLRLSCQCPVGQTSMRKKMASLLAEVEADFPSATKNCARAALKFGTKKAATP